VEYTTTYNILDTVPISAGIGAFNVSIALAWIPSYLAFTFAIASDNIFLDASRSISIAPPICYGASTCTTYYINGGIGLTHPDVFQNKTLAPEADVFIQRQTPGILVSMWQVDSAEVNAINSSQIDCIQSESSDMAFQICLAPSTMYTNHIVAGKYRTCLLS
jgi:hypothetical protein